MEIKFWDFKDWVEGEEEGGEPEGVVSGGQHLFWVRLRQKMTNFMLENELLNIALISAKPCYYSSHSEHPSPTFYKYY